MLFWKAGNSLGNGYGLQMYVLACFFDPKHDFRAPHNLDRVLCGEIGLNAVGVVDWSPLDI